MQKLKSFKGIATKPVQWTIINNDFTPKYIIPEVRSGQIKFHFNRNASELDVFKKLFPNSLLMYMHNVQMLELLKIIENRANWCRKNCNYIGYFSDYGICNIATMLLAGPNIQ